jgi:hypothetical protein
MKLECPYPYIKCCKIPKFYFTRLFPQNQWSQFPLFQFPEPFNPLKWERKGASGGRGGNIFKFGKPTPKQRWKTVFNKTKITPRGTLYLPTLLPLPLVLVSIQMEMDISFLCSFGHYAAERGSSESDDPWKSPPSPRLHNEHASSTEN